MVKEFTLVKTTVNGVAPQNRINVIEILFEIIELVLVVEKILTLRKALVVGS